jgi:hypothetical protein
MNIIKKTLAILAIIGLAACSDFDDMNLNPNAPNEINNNPELLLTGISKNLVNRMVSNGWSEGNVMGQYAAKIVFTEFDQFEWGTNTSTWNTIYTMGRESQNLATIAETTNNDSYKAVALILTHGRSKLPPTFGAISLTVKHSKEKPKASTHRFTTNSPLFMRPLSRTSKQPTHC